MWGTKTGRMTTRKHYFPILTLDSDYRSIIKPTNDYFVELDYNAAELRVLLGLSGKEQPIEDLHTWNLNNVYGGSWKVETKQRSGFSLGFITLSQGIWPTQAFL